VNPERQAIVDALTAVPGISASHATPAPIVTGSAWPVRSAIEWINDCATDTTWFVFVALPNGTDWATVDAGDAVVDDIAAALWQVGKVARAEPWQFPIEPGQQAVPLLRFTLEV
jgi:hypothetical protein